MKKIVTIISFIGVLFLSFLMYTLHSLKVFPEQSNSEVECHSVAILTPVTHPSLQQIQRGFLDTLESDGSKRYVFDVYNANGNKRLMHAQVEEIIQKKYDLIFSMCAQASQMAKEITTKKQQSIPIVFAAVSDPVSINLIDSLDCSKNHVVGAVEVTDYATQLAVLRTLIPNPKKVLLVYDPTQGIGLEKDKKKIAELFSLQNIELMSAEVYCASEVYAKVGSLCQDADAILILKDNTVVSAIDSLVKFCNQRKIPLMATDLDSVAKGAACAFGVCEYDYGVVGAQLAHKILEDGCSPSDLCSYPVDSFKICVNLQAMRQQGVNSQRIDNVRDMNIEVIRCKESNKVLS